MFLIAQSSDTATAIATYTPTDGLTFPSEPSYIHALVTCAKPNAKLASPAAFPIKLNHPHIYEENGAHFGLASIPAQW